MKNNGGTWEGSPVKGSDGLIHGSEGFLLGLDELSDAIGSSPINVGDIVEF